MRQALVMASPLQCAFTPLAGDTRTMKTDKKGALRLQTRISYRIDRRLTALASPDYDATVSLWLPFEPEDCQYGKSRPMNSRFLRT